MCRRRPRKLSVVAVPPDFAVVGGRAFTRLAEISDHADCLDGRGQWVVVLPFDGSPVYARFEDLWPAEGGWPERLLGGRREWQGPPAGSWESSLDRDAFTKGVRVIRDAIASGDVYQVNLCRVLRAPLEEPV